MLWYVILLANVRCSERIYFAIGEDLLMQMPSPPSKRARTNKEQDDGTGMKTRLFNNKQATIIIYLLYLYIFLCVFLYI